MSPPIKIQREKILETAFEMTREKGINSINARELAKRLNCSTQPIFSSFVSILELKEEIRRMAKDRYNKYINDGLKEEKPYKGIGKAYIRFAKEETNLFKLLFMNDEQDKKDFVIEEDNNEKIYETIYNTTGMNKEEAIKFHTEVWIFTHGIATLIASKSISFTEEEISEMLTDIFTALLKKYKES